MMKSALIAAFAAGIAVPGAALAQCATVDPVVVPQVRLDVLDAAGAGELVQPFTLTFRRAEVGGAPRTIRYQIVDEDSAVLSRVGLSQGPTVEWRAEDSPRDIGAFRSEAYALLRSGAALLGQDDQAAQRTVSLRVTNLRQDLPAGVYREQFTVRYWCEDPSGGPAEPYEAQGAVAVSVAVPNVLSANIGGASAHGEIDFMDFAVRERDVQISVRSTGPYQVTARSQNGALVREGAGLGDDADRIAYTARFDGRPLGAAGQAMPRAGLLGRQVSLTVEVEDTRAKRAGDYAEVLFLTLAPAN